MRPAGAFEAELHRLRRALYAANQSLIDAALEGPSAAFRRYEARYHATVRRARRPASWRSVVEASRRARVALLGDYHTFAPSQRSYVELLDAQTQGPLILALEMLPGSGQREIDRFARGEIRRSTLLRRLDLAHRWPLGALEALEPIAERARRHGHRLLGIDRPGSLADRDRYAAERIALALAEQPGGRALVLIGECHLAPPHLPRALELALAARRIEGTVLRIHQNPEAIWFALDARGLAERHDVLELDAGAYALFNASPLICQQSFLTWLDELDAPEERAAVPDPDSGRRLVRQSLAVIGRALDLPVRGLAAELEVVGPADLTFFGRLFSGRLFSKEELRQIRSQILASESYYLPRAKLIYLATLSLAHAAEEAAHALRHRASGEALDEPLSPIDAFYARVMNEALGFLGSKLVHPKRPCPSPERLAAWLAAGQLAGADRTAAQLAIAHQQIERGQAAPELARAFQGGPDLFNRVTHLIGYDLGERIYQALVRGQLAAREARGLFFEPLEEEGAALLAFLELAGRVRRKARRAA